MRTLDDIGTAYGTDKGSLLHDYLPIYERLTSQGRYQTTSLLEIGVQYGASLRMWADWFPNATITGIDVAANNVSFDNPRIKFIVGDANNPNVHGQLTRFDVIVDDGSHYDDDIVNSFKIYFPKLSCGGLYIIEDLHACYHEEFNPRRAPSAMTFLKNLVDDVNWRGIDMKGSRKNPEQRGLNDYERHIESITFLKSLCIIQKT